MTRKQEREHAPAPIVGRVSVTSQDRWVERAVEGIALKTNALCRVAFVVVIFMSMHQVGTEQSGNSANQHVEWVDQDVATYKNIFCFALRL